MELQDVKYLQQSEIEIKDQGFSELIFQGEFDEEFTIIAHYYRRSVIKTIIQVILTIGTGGGILLFFRWFLVFKLNLCFSKCSFEQARYVYLKKQKNNIEIADPVLVEINIIDIDNVKSARTFKYEFLDFYIDPLNFKMYSIKCSFSNKTCNQLVTERQEIPKIYGPNIMDIPVKSIPGLLLDEILTPFNIFQFGAIALWSYDDYLLYAMLILALTLIQIFVELKELRANLIKIRKMILFETAVEILKDGKKQMISSKELMPGDIFFVQNNSKVSCDAIIIEGQCTMNEAILTGESIPVNKVALLKTENLFKKSQNEQSMLYSGTVCLRSQGKDGQLAQALVYQTGFHTLKGSLARTMMFSKTETFSFQRDSVKYLGVLAMYGIIAAGFTLYLNRDNGTTSKDNIISALEIITVTVPAALPTALGAGISLAISRLAHKNISCIKPDKVNVAAKINICAFDKTGTLTELGLDVLGCRPVTQGGFNRQMSLKEVDSHFQYCLATCHSLSIIDNQIQGDPVDLNMFKETGWTYTDDGVINNEEQLRLIRRFDFSAEQKKMSVITDKLFLYCKGSPEEIMKICIKIPPNYDSVLKRYSSRGYRVIACAYREIMKEEYTQVEVGDRSLFEKNLHLLGFLIFENKLKQETTSQTQKPLWSLEIILIQQLMFQFSVEYLEKGRIYLGTLNGEDILWDEIQDQKGDINEDRSCYSLDNLSQHQLTTQDILKLTIRYQLVVTGDVFENLSQTFYSGKDYTQKLLPHIYVYSRMKPTNKGDLMGLIKSDDRNFISFCGDGTNDTCALRQADIGLALSTEDASLAAPFTSSDFNITGILPLIKEGRASLVTCVECFKFMTLYSCIQSVATLTCYYYFVDLTNNQYLFQDLVLIFPIAFTMDLTKAYDKLAKYRPISELISVPVLSSVLVTFFLCIVTSITWTTVMKQKQFFLDSSQIYQDNTPNFINTVTTMMADTQLLAVGFAFTQGPPFRQLIHENYAFVTAMTIGFVMQILFITSPEIFIWSNTVEVFPVYFRWESMGYCILTSLVIIAYEKLITMNQMVNDIYQLIQNKNEIQFQQFW
ncbi:hypothetical protein pb186bvf_005258 [Paramecium bursaria]